MSTKVVIIGDTGVGKTCLLTAFDTQMLWGDYIPTVFDNFVVSMNLQGRPLNLHFWDTAGQSEYDRLRQLSYPGTNFTLIAYSCANTHSFARVAKWKQEALAHMPEAKLILVATKIDYCNSHYSEGDKLITKEEGQQLAKTIGAIGFFETSALTGQGCRDLLDFIYLSDTQPSVTSYHHTNKCVLF